METISAEYRRKSRRVSATIPISVMVQSEDFKTEHDAYTVDLSRHGVRVRATFALVSGERVGIVPSGDSGQSIPARVVWVERAESGRGSVAGLEFINPLPT